MNILIIQENGEHEINRNFRECHSLKRAFDLTTDVVNCDIWGPGHNLFITCDVDFNAYDIIVDVVQRNHFMPWYPTAKLKNARAYKIQWVIDGHTLDVGLFDHIYNTCKFDLQMHACVEFCNNTNKPWFPNCVDDTIVYPHNQIKKHLLGFCGSISNRGGVIENLAKKYHLNKDIDVLGENMVNAINSYYIHFNKNVSFDINFRTFETMACNTLLLTNYHPKNKDLGFIDNVNMIEYKTINELYEKVDYFTNGNKLNEINKISNAGYNLVKLKHTYEKRIQSIMKFIKTKI